MKKNTMMQVEKHVSSLSSQKTNLNFLQLQLGGGNTKQGSK